MKQGRAGLFNRLEREGVTFRPVIYSRDGYLVPMSVVTEMFELVDVEHGRHIARAIYLRGDDGLAIADIYDLATRRMGARTRPLTRARVSQAVFTELAYPVRCEHCKGKGIKNERVCGICDGKAKVKRSRNWLMHACGQTNPDKFEEFVLPGYADTYLAAVEAVDFFVSKLVEALCNRRGVVKC